MSKLENKLLGIEKTTLTPQMSELNKLNELADRQSRAQSIILYNLPESLNNTHSPSDCDRLKIIFN